MNISDWIKTLSGVLVPISIFAAGALISYCTKVADDSKLNQEKQLANQAAEQKKIADDNQADAKLIADLLKGFSSVNVQERVLTVKFVEILILSEDVPAKYTSIIELAKHDPNPAVQEAGNKAAENFNKEIQDNPISKVTKNLAEAAKTKGITFLSNAKFRTRIFLHIRDEAERGRAKEISAILEENNYLVPGIEKVNAGPRTCEVRYFIKENAGTAGRIKTILESHGVKNISVLLITGFENSPSANSFEVWFGDNAFG